jgi:predicted metal-dependent hydrolase
MSTFTDDEFGLVTIRRSRIAKSIKLSMAPNGTLRVSMPLYAPVFMAKRLIASSRKDIRSLSTAQHSVLYEHNMQIGKSHILHVQHGASLSVSVQGQIITAILPVARQVSDTQVQSKIREVVIKALRKESKAYLPRRLAYLANQYNFSYETVRFSHASSRWGSCSSTGTISLNIALMKLDHSLIDYVLLHELCHTKEMNHSKKFWELMTTCDPSFKSHKSLLKEQSPSV